MAGARSASQVRAVGTAFLRQRPIVTAPLVIGNLALFAAGGAPRAQLVVLAIALASMQTMFTIERVIGARRPLAEATLVRSVVVTAIGLGVGCLLSGGLASPVVPLLLAPTGIAFAAFGRSRTSAALLAILIATVAALALVPLPFPPLGSPHREVALGLALVGGAVLLRLGVAALADAHAAAAAVLARAGDDAAWAAAARGREVEAMGAQVAHEVKNPLAAIRGLVEVMIEARDPADRDHRRLSVVAGEVARIEQILRDYLEQHRPTAALERTTVDVGALIEDVCAVLEARAERAGVALSWDGAAAPADVDARRLKEALLNLALNAVDASARGGAIDVRWARADGQVAIEIADRGRGMTADELARIGTRGFTTKDGGTGLGVALARGVIEQHGGRLTFTSAPGQGTIAVIRLPAEPRASTTP